MAAYLLLPNNSRAQDCVRSQYVRDANKDSVIVFIHGVLGDARATWTNSNTKAFWPDLMKDDPFFDRFDVYIYGYSSPLRDVSYTINELADDMRRDLDGADVFQKHKEVVFLCHSMGGLVVRAFLLRYRNYVSQVPMIYFFSTPTTGAQVASLGKILSSNPQVGAMLPIGGPANEYLASIQHDWLAANFPVASHCAYEVQDTYGIKVVSEASATHLCNRPLDPINANHFDMVKPRGRSDTPYISFRNAVRELKQRQISKPETPPAKPQRPIEISLTYYPDTLPIRVPAGSNGHVFWLGEVFSKRFEVADLYQIYNISGVDTKLWPDMTVIEEAKKKSDPGVNSVWRFDITNHGQDNILELKVPFLVTYGVPPDARCYRNAVIINPLDHGKTYTFYVMNNCPATGSIRVPKFAQAKVVGEQAPRQFQLELENPQPGSQNLQFDGTRTNWTGNGCE